jgi:prepilin-type N-terminal cleavage/methylation domain-containing protein
VTASRLGSRGYTIVELMMSLSVLALGATGIIAMQKVTLASNAHAKNLAVATSVASAWADALTADASLWNGNTDLGDTNWLGAISPNPAWIRPAYNATVGLGAAFSVLGGPLDDTQLGLAAYCVDYRLAWIVDPAPLVANNQPGGGLIRAEVRVSWRRDGSLTVPATALCSAAALAEADGAEEPAYHFVHVSTAIAQTGTGGS